MQNIAKKDKNGGKTLIQSDPERKSAEIIG